MSRPFAAQFDVSKLCVESSHSELALIFVHCPVFCCSKRFNPVQDLK